MSNPIRILLVRPNQPPRALYAPSSLERLQLLVGGPLEIACRLPKGGLVVCGCQENAGDKPPNRRHPSKEGYIAGTFFLCGCAGGDLVSLTPEQEAEGMDWFSSPGEFMTVGDSVCSTPNELILQSYRLWDEMKDGDRIILVKQGGAKRAAG